MTTSAPTREAINLPDTARTERAVLLVITALGLLLRLVAVLTRGMQYDEAYSALHYGGEPLAKALSDYSLPNNHLFHTLLLHLTTLFGLSPLAVRLPALLASTALIPAVYVLTRRLYRGPAPLIAAALTAVAVHLLDYASNARGYALVALLTVLMALAAERTRTDTGWKPWIALVATAVLGLYTIPTMLYAAAGVAVWLLLRLCAGESALPRRAALGRLALAAAAVAVLTLLLYLPVILHDGFAALAGNATVQRVAYDVLWPRLGAMCVDTWLTWHLQVPVVLAALPALALLVALTEHNRLSTSRVPLLPVLVGVAALAVVAQGVAPFARVWIYLLPCYLMTAAAGLAAVAGWLRATSAGAGLLVALALGLVYLAPAGNLIQQWRNDPLNTANLADLFVTRSHAGDYLLADSYLVEPLTFYCKARGVKLESLTSNPMSALLRTSGESALPFKAWVYRPDNGETANRDATLSALHYTQFYPETNRYRFGPLVVEELALPVLIQ